MKLSNPRVNNRDAQNELTYGRYKLSGYLAHTGTTKHNGFMNTPNPCT